MNNDSGIICFRHCYNKNIYCLNIPTKCPVCDENIQNSYSIPIRVPYPFVRASQHPCSVVVKPTQNEFLKHYQLMDDLHIGVTTSRGNVVSYDFDGISEDTKNWQECLVVFQLDDKSLEKQWDTLLSDFVKNDRWNNDRYNEEDHNCFSFTLDFFKQFNKLKPSMHRVETREDFTKLYIVDTTINSYKYICLYRNIIQNGFYIYNDPAKEILSE